MDDGSMKNTTLVPIAFILFLMRVSGTALAVIADVTNFFIFWILMFFSNFQSDTRLQKYALGTKTIINVRNWINSLFYRYAYLYE